MAQNLGSSGGKVRAGPRGSSSSERAANAGAVIGRARALICIVVTTIVTTIASCIYTSGRELDRELGRELDRKNLNMFDCRDPTRDRLYDGRKYV